MKSSENQPMKYFGFATAVLIAALFAAPAAAADRSLPAPVVQLTYADLVDLADSAPLVVKARIRTQKTLGPELSPGLRQGWVRLLIEADTVALISGRAPIGESLRYLADVPLDAKGKPAKLKKQAMLVFALPVPGHPGDLQLIDVDSQIPADDATEARLHAILTELAAPDAPPIVTSVGDALAVAGNLSGESETQVFLTTKTGAPVSLNVVRRPEMTPEWGVSWTELVDQSAQPPRQDTLEWYRLACFLPASLPHDSILSSDGASRVLAAKDYRYVLDQLGPCTRTRGGPPQMIAGT
jgi:hypothetical protein